MKVLYIHQYFTTPSGFGGVRSFQFAKHLISEGHEVKMICASNSASNTGLKNNFTFFSRKGVYQEIEIKEYNLFYSNKMNKFQRSLKFLLFTLFSIIDVLTNKYDLIICSSTPLTVGIPGMISKILRKKKFVFEVRDKWPDLLISMGVIKNKFFIYILKFLEITIYKTADKIITLAPGISESIISQDIPSNKIKMIPNGCDFDLFQIKKNINTKVDKYNYLFNNNEDLIAIYAGTHGLANGLNYLIKTAKILKDEKVNNIKIILIGDGLMKNKLIQYAKIYSLNNIFFLNKIEKNKLNYIFSKSDVGLQILANVKPFYNGTSPNKFFDYLSADLPIIINYPGWLSNLVKEYKCGFEVLADSPDDLARLLIKLKNNKNILLRKKNNSFNLAKENFNRSELKKEWLEWILDEKK